MTTDRNELTVQEIFDDYQLLYAATARCKCGAGMAYPLDHEKAFKTAAWQCSTLLHGNAHLDDYHEILPFSMWKVRKETSINNREGLTTRPEGTVCLTKGEATCPKCSHYWESEPYNACGVSHHWFSGPCPKCSYAVGGGESYTSGDGPAIDSRFRDVVVKAEEHGHE